MYRNTLTMSAMIRTPLKTAVSPKGYGSPSYPDGPTVNCRIVPVSARSNAGPFGRMQVGNFTGYFDSDTTIAAECRVEVSATEVYRVLSVVDWTPLGRSAKIADMERMNTV